MKFQLTEVSTQKIVRIEAAIGSARMSMVAGGVPNSDAISAGAVVASGRSH
jgi:hypothetical protein